MNTQAKHITSAKESLRALMGQPADVLVIAGSGFRDALPILQNTQSCQMSQIPHIPCPKVTGHGADFFWGKIDGKMVLIATGRVHLYEGYAPADVVFVIRMAAALGCRSVVLTNAAGSVDFAFPTSSLVAIADQINLTGSNPQAGHSAQGTLFTDMTECYHDAWRRAVVADTGIHSGVYAGLLGPSYETRAEATMLARLGANMVGMSTVHECIAARALNLNVLGLSFITNMSGGLSGPTNHQDVLKSAHIHTALIQSTLYSAITHTPA